MPRGVNHLPLEIVCIRYTGCKMIHQWRFCSNLHSDLHPQHPRDLRLFSLWTDESNHIRYAHDTFSLFFFNSGGIWFIFNCDVSPSRKPNIWYSYRTDLLTRSAHTKLSICRPVSLDWFYWSRTTTDAKRESDIFAPQSRSWKIPNMIQSSWGPEVNGNIHDLPPLPFYFSLP